jgi:hypothetical protein
MGAANMHRSIKARTEQPSPMAFIRTEILCRADICSEALDRARSLSQLGRPEPPLLQLLARARELLDEIDEMLAVLDPSSDRLQFATVATLHRRLEHLQATIATQPRARASGSRSATGR